ncbi:hypothetical protein V6N13_070880 [Hibiscus sabdariffa]|uniref:RING-type E3 ubiquitin transferase n=1 Tax=Hibiscus sabdariffa TaxID=183260 RepID=A0ABR2TF68_9ROSI
MVSQQEFQRVELDVQQLQTDLHRVKTTVADRCSQVERTISAVRVEIRDELAVFKNDMQSQISGLESIIKKIFEQPRVPTGVTTESLASPAIIDAISRPVVTVDMLPKIPASLEMKIQKSTALSLHDVYHTMGLETGLRDPVRGKAPMYVGGSSSDFEAGRGRDLSDPTRGLLGPKPSIGNELFLRRCGSNSIQVSKPVQTGGNRPIHDRKRYPIQTSSVRRGQESKEESMKQRIDVKDKRKTKQAPDVSCSSPSPALECMDKLREELSCAICLDICYEPSTTPCGHSFCKKCLRSAADKCGKRCPKCRQLISNEISCALNRVLWNIIQLLFPKEVSEARKSAAGALNSRKVECRSPESGRRSTRRTRSVRPPTVSTRDAALALRLQREDLSRLESTNDSSRRRRQTPSQDEDAALALRLQREEFMESSRGNHQQTRTPPNPSFFS